MRLDQGDQILEQNAELDGSSSLKVIREGYVMRSHRLFRNGRYECAGFGRYTWVEMGGFNDQGYPAFTFSSRKVQR